MVGEFSHVQRRAKGDAIFEGAVHGRAFFSGIRSAYERNGYDYLEPSAKLALSAVPSSFGGVSGGGLWEVRLSKTPAGKLSWDGRRYFRGVAFWESEIEGAGRRVIRCHGAKSIFEKAWKVWGLSNG